MIKNKYSSTAFPAKRSFHKIFPNEYTGAFESVSLNFWVNLNIYQQKV